MRIGSTILMRKGSTKGMGMFFSWSRFTSYPLILLEIQQPANSPVVIRYNILIPYQERMEKSMAAQNRLVSIVVPVFNEQEALPAFHAGLVEALEGLPYEFHILYVNDGSTDQTSAIL
ncbi:MAG: glycosyltransferase, partial [Anaerolineaceae bacterium]|nr:glycosyltransferase [Anaerolineaceae bacterium]